MQKWTKTCICTCLARPVGPHCNKHCSDPVSQKEGSRTLSGLLGIHAEAFTYSRELEAVADSFPAGEAPRLEQYQRVARDQGFRRSVVFTYNHRCALCGLRIVTPEGHTAVDAAHIVPWSQTRNDDIRNGMALCKLCHWSFDKWLIGVSDAYTVIVSRQLMQEHNMAGFLGDLTDKEVFRPEDRALWPHQNYLGEHRKKLRA